MSVRSVLLAGRSILVVEDEPLVAVNVHAPFSAAGASIISAANSREALRMISLPDLSAAIVDINLGKENCSAVCKFLSCYRFRKSAEKWRQLRAFPVSVSPRPYRRETGNAVCLASDATAKTG
jgi:CheY-like chemotaxis protein